MEGLPWGLSGQEPAWQYRRHGFHPWSGKILWRRNGNPLQYSCWEIPWTEDPGELQSMGSQRIGHNLVPEQQAMGTTKMSVICEQGETSKQEIKHIVVWWVRWQGEPWGLGDRYLFQFRRARVFQLLFHPQNKKKTHILKYFLKQKDPSWCLSLREAQN